MMTPRLHVPDEPSVQLEAWRSRLRDGELLDRVLDGADGVVEWYWRRWRALERQGVDEARFRTIVGGHARELGLWLRGERPHRSVASSLAGRVERRVAEVARRDDAVGVDDASAVLARTG